MARVPQVPSFRPASSLRPDINASLYFIKHLVTMSDRKLKLRQCKQSGATAGPRCTHRDAWWSKRIAWIVRTTASSVAAVGRHGQDIAYRIISRRSQSQCSSDSQSESLAHTFPGNWKLVLIYMAPVLHASEASIPFFWKAKAHTITLASLQKNASMCLPPAYPWHGLT